MDSDMRPPHGAERENPAHTSGSLWSAGVMTPGNHQEQQREEEEKECECVVETISGVGDLALRYSM